MKTTVLLADINDFAKVNEVYSTCKYQLFKFVQYLLASGNAKKMGYIKFTCYTYIHKV